MDLEAEVVDFIQTVDAEELPYLILDIIRVVAAVATAEMAGRVREFLLVLLVAEAAVDTVEVEEQELNIMVAEAVDFSVPVEPHIIALPTLMVAQVVAVAFSPMVQLALHLQAAQAEMAGS